MPGFPIRAFHENPAKHPDSIGAEDGEETEKRAYSGFFILVFCAKKIHDKGK
jgi:hypothetical protein